MNIANDGHVDRSSKTPVVSTFPSLSWSDASNGGGGDCPLKIF